MDQNTNEHQTGRHPHLNTHENLARTAFIDKEHGSTSEHPPKDPHKKNFLQRLSPKPLIEKFKKLPRKQKIIVIAVLLFILAGFVWLMVLLFGGNEEGPTASIAQINDQRAPKTVPSELTGLPVAPEVNSKQVTAVMVENSPDARPQSGLKDAGIVFEAVAEAGITRFMLLFQDTDAKLVGPIRSARPYYIDWLMPFDAAYAHVGGSPKALDLIRKRKVKDLDQFSAPRAYERVSTRFAPHNVYTNTSKLDQLEKDRGFNSSSYTGFVRKAEEEKRKKPKAKNIQLNISTGLYGVEFRYNKQGNTYSRFMGGQAHRDEKSGKIIKPKVVIAMVTKKGLASDGYHTAYKTVGGGKVFIFQDGDVIKGKWQRKSLTDQYKFKDNKGKTIELTPGKTWITVLGDKSEVKY